MKTVFISLIILANVNVAFSQASQCIPKIDSNDVKKIAKRKNVYWTNDWVCPPALKFDSLTCEWSIYTCKRKWTKKGDCKHTNGCVVTTTSTLVIDAITSKVVSLEKKKQVTHAYE